MIWLFMTINYLLWLIDNHIRIADITLNALKQAAGVRDEDDTVRNNCIIYTSVYGATNVR